MERVVFELTLRNGRDFLCGERSREVCDGCGGGRGMDVCQSRLLWLVEGVQVTR